MQRTETHKPEHGGKLPSGWGHCTLCPDQEYPSQNFVMTFTQTCQRCLTMETTLLSQQKEAFVGTTSIVILKVLPSPCLHFEHCLHIADMSAVTSQLQLHNPSPVERQIRNLNKCLHTIVNVFNFGGPNIKLQLKIFEIFNTSRLL